MLLARRAVFRNIDRMAPMSRPRTSSSTALKAARPSVVRESVPAPAPRSPTPEPLQVTTEGKSAAELRTEAEIFVQQAIMLETMADGLPEPSKTNLRGEAAVQRATAKGLLIKADHAEQTERAAKLTKRNTEASRRMREKKSTTRDQALAAEVREEESFRQAFPEELIQIGPDDFDDDAVSDTYEGSDTPRKLAAILELVKSTPYGVITSGMVRNHVRNADGSMWGGNPVRNQLRKLVQRRELVARSYAGPRPTKQGFASKDVMLYARKDEHIDAQIKAWREQARLARAGLLAKS